MKLPKTLDVGSMTPHRHNNPPSPHIDAPEHPSVDHERMMDAMANPSGHERMMDAMDAMANPSPHDREGQFRTHKTVVMVPNKEYLLSWQKVQCFRARARVTVTITARAGATVRVSARVRARARANNSNRALS